MVKVGAATETEMKEKKHRVEDALQATRAALEEGIVPGGGVALLNAAKAIKADELEGDERTGAQIVVRALEEPLRQLSDNAGLEGSLVVDKIRTGTKGHGLNVETGEYEDLVKAGIIDPTMVTRSALQNAASIAKNILTTEAIVAEPPEKTPRRRRRGHARHGRDDVTSDAGASRPLAYTGEPLVPPWPPPCERGRRSSVSGAARGCSYFGRLLCCWASRRAKPAFGGDSQSSPRALGAPSRLPRSDPYSEALKRRDRLGRSLVSSMRSKLLSA